MLEPVDASYHRFVSTLFASSLMTFISQRYSIVSVLVIYLSLVNCKEYACA